LAAGRLRQAGIVLKPLLRSAGLSVDEISRKDIRISVASQIRFLELPANALKDPLLGFKLARDGELRQIGLLHYVAAGQIDENFYHIDISLVALTARYTRRLNTALEPDVRISRIRLSDWLHREAHERNHCRLATAPRARSMRLEAERLIA
jgi:hypothetical protein